MIELIRGVVLDPRPSARTPVIEPDPALVEASLRLQ